MRALRALPERVPDVPGDRAGSGVAARADPHGEAGGRGAQRADALDPGALGTLPAMPRVRSGLPERRAVRSHPGTRARTARCGRSREQDAAAGCESSCCGTWSRGGECWRWPWRRRAGTRTLSCAGWCGGAGCCGAGWQASRRSCRGGLGKPRRPEQRALTPAASPTTSGTGRAGVGAPACCLPAASWASCLGMCIARRSGFTSGPEYRWRLQRARAAAGRFTPTTVTLHSRGSSRGRTSAALERTSGPIVVNSAGCGAAMKEYGDLLAKEPRWADRAAAFSARVKGCFGVAREPARRAVRGPRHVPGCVPPCARSANQGWPAGAASRTGRLRAHRDSRRGRVLRGGRHLFAGATGDVGAAAFAEGGAVRCGAARCHRHGEPRAARCSTKQQCERPGINARVMHLMEVLDEATTDRTDGPRSR